MIQNQVQIKVHLIKFTWSHLLGVDGGNFVSFTLTLLVKEIRVCKSNELNIELILSLTNELQRDCKSHNALCVHFDLATP